MSAAQPSRPSSVVLRPLSHGRPNYSDAFPSVGEVIMMCLPFDMPGGSSIVPSTAISGSSSRNYHPCVVVEHRVDYSGGLDDLKWSAVIYVCRSYSGESDPTAYVESLGQDRKVLLPVPSLHCPDTPVEFGEPLRFDNFFARSPTWLVAGGPYEAHMGGNGPYKKFDPPAFIAEGELERLGRYQPLGPTETSISTEPFSPPGHSGPGHRGDHIPSDNGRGASRTLSAVFPSGVSADLSKNTGYAAQGSRNAGDRYYCEKLGRYIVCLGEVPQDDDDDDDDDCSNASSFPRGFDVVDMILLGEPEHPVFAPMRKQQMQMRVERWLNEL